MTDNPYTAARRGTDDLDAAWCYVERYRRHAFEIRRQVRIQFGGTLLGPDIEDAISHFGKVIEHMDAALNVVSEAMDDLDAREEAEHQRVEAANLRERQV